MKKIFLHTCFPFLFLLSVSCNKELHPVKMDMTYYNIADTLPVDPAIISYISPFKDSMEKEMEEVIAFSAIQMSKNKPESLMGNLIADLVLKKAGDYFKDKVQISMLNYGGLRLPDLPAGEITKGKIFELMPFDNFLVIMFLKGSVVKKLADAIAVDGGWPVAGIKFSIHEGAAQNILVGAEPLDTNRIYNVAISDYLADGGDNLFFLRNEKRENLGIFLRDVIIEYLKEVNSAGDSLTSHLDHRISIE